MIRYEPEHFGAASHRKVHIAASLRSLRKSQVSALITRALDVSLFRCAGPKPAHSELSMLTRGDPGVVVDRPGRHTRRAGGVVCRPSAAGRSQSPCALKALASGIPRIAELF